MNAFREALDVLRTDGWCKAALHKRSTGEHCAIGALCVARPGENRLGLYRDLDRVAGELFPDRLQPGVAGGSEVFTITVNNHPDTTFEDMEQIFEKAAIRAEEII